MSASRLRSTCNVLLGCLLAASPSLGRIIYVDADVPVRGGTPPTRGARGGWSGSATGSSWADAHADLYTALATARIGDEIRIAQGVYTPVAGSSLYARAFELTGGLTLVGGYAGVGEPDPNARDVRLYATILSGDVKGNDAPIDDPRKILREPTRTDNCCVISNALPPRNTLDGLTITGGRDAVRLFNASMILRDCTLIGNLGSAIFVNQGDVYLENCRFLVNAAESVGGALGGGLSLGRSSATLINCEFTGNYADLGGGLAASESLVSLSGCTFRGNSAGTGGAIYGNGSLTVTACRFENNVARYQGGAIVGDLMVLSHCHFLANSAGDYGGALCGLIGPSRVSNCIFAGNRASEGGALYSSYCGPLLLNCTLTGNRAQTGPACAWATPSPPRGGRSTNDTPFQMTVTNCILWDGPAEMANKDGRTAQITVTYSDVFGGWPGAGNIDADPRFASPGYWDFKGTSDNPNDDVWVTGDYHLKSQAGRCDPVKKDWVQDEVTSPCINAGDPKTPVGDEPRPNGGRIDMGAYGGTVEASKSPL